MRAKSPTFWLCGIVGYAEHWCAEVSETAVLLKVDFDQEPYFYTSEFDRKSRE